MTSQLAVGAEYADGYLLIDVALADATLRVIETGTPKEMFDARLGPFKLAPDAAGRVLALLETQHERVREAGLLSVLYDVVLLSTTHRAAGLDVLRAGLNRFDDRERLEIAAERDFDWLVDHLPLCREGLEPADWLYFSRDNQLRLLEALLHKDPAYVDRVVDQALGVVASRCPKDLIADIMSAHPVYAAALAARPDQRNSSPAATDSVGREPQRARMFVAEGMFTPPEMGSSSKPVPIAGSGQLLFATLWFVYDHGVSVLRLLVEAAMSAHAGTSATSASGDR